MLAGGADNELIAVPTCSWIQVSCFMHEQLHNFVSCSTFIGTNSIICAQFVFHHETRKLCLEETSWKRSSDPGKKMSGGERTVRVFYVGRQGTFFEFSII